MAECRACLAKNVRMHSITNTGYREMFEKVTGNKLSIEDGRPETICYICNAQLQRFSRFFKMSQKTEKILTSRLLFGIQTQGTLDTNICQLSTTAVKAVSFMDDGSEAAPEVTVTVKEEMDDADEWERFKEEFMDSASDEFENDYEPIAIRQTNDTKITDQDKDISNLLKNTEEEEFKNKLLDSIKTEAIETEETINEENSMIENTTEEIPIKTEDTLYQENFIKEEKFPENSIKEKPPLKADMRYHAPKPKHVAFYYCDKCEYHCQQLKTLRRHNRHHDLNNQFVCSLCLYRFPDEIKLNRHKTYCTVCKICGKKFHNLNGLRIHVRLHTGELPFTCDLCGRGFNQKTNLQTHLRVHAREKQFPCEICLKIFPFSSYLQRHMLIHSENNIDGESMHQIQNCHKLFSRKKKKAMSSCTVCGKILRKDSMSMHMRLHTGEQPFSCEKCNRFFNQKCNLLTHVERCHPGDPLFACKVCFKTFAMNSELRKHLVSHGVKIEIKKELLAQTEDTIKKFISRYEKEVEQRMEVLTEADKKMELIFNLGLKPRVINSQEPIGMIVIPNLNDKGRNIKATKRKGSTLDPGIRKAKAKRKATELTLLPDSLDFKVNGTKIEKKSPNNTKDNKKERNSTVKKIMKTEHILLQDSFVQDGQENDLASPHNVTSTVMSQELQNVVSKAHDPSNVSKNNTEIANSFTTLDSRELNCIFVATESYRNINKESNVETQIIKEVEIKRELISENEDLTENVEVLLECKGNTKPVEKINLSNKMTNENMAAEGVSIKNESGDFEYRNVINSEDIEYFDDGIEIVEVEISDSEELTEQNAESEGITTNKDLEHTEVVLNQNALAGPDEGEITNKEVPTEELKAKSQVLLSDEDHLKNEVARRQSTSYTGVEVSVIDPNDVDYSDIDSEQENIEEEYLDLSDDELIDDDDDSLDGSFNEEVQNDTLIDLVDAEENINMTDDTLKLFRCNEPRIKLRSDLFADHLKPNLYVEDSLETDITSEHNTTEDNTLTEEANISFIANNDDDLEVIATEENQLDFTDTEYLDSDSSFDHLETVAANKNNVDTLAANENNVNTLAANEDHSKDINIIEAELNSESNDGNPISVRDFDSFQQNHMLCVHSKINSQCTPYPCDLCVTVFSY